MIWIEGITKAKEHIKFITSHKFSSKCITTDMYVSWEIFSFPSEAYENRIFKCLCSVIEFLMHIFVLSYLIPSWNIFYLFCFCSFVHVFPFFLWEWKLFLIFANCLKKMLLNLVNYGNKEWIDCKIRLFI